MSCQVLSPGVQECKGPVVDEVGEVVLRIVRPMLLRHPVHREGVVIVLGVANLGQGMVISSIYGDKQGGQGFLKLSTLYDSTDQSLPRVPASGNLLHPSSSRQSVHVHVLTRVHGLQ